MLQTLCTLTDLPHGLGLRFKDLLSLTEQIFISLEFLRVYIFFFLISGVRFTRVWFLFYQEKRKAFR